MTIPVTAALTLQWLSPCLNMLDMGPEIIRQKSGGDMEIFKNLVLIYLFIATLFFISGCFNLAFRRSAIPLPDKLTGSYSIYFSNLVASLMWPAALLLRYTARGRALLKESVEYAKEEYK